MKASITIAWIAAAVVGQRAAWANPPPPITITATVQPVARWTVDFDEVRARHADVVIAGYATGNVEVYPLNASPSARRTKACTFAVAAAGGGNGKLDLFAAPSTDACAALIAPLRADQDLEVAISPPGSTEYAVIAYSAPRVYQGKDPTIAIVDNGDGVPVWGQNLKLPDHVKLSADHRCFLLLDDWIAETCAEGPAPMTFAAATLAVIGARWARGDTVELIINAIDADSSTGAWRRVPMILKAKKPPEPEPHAGDDDSLDMRCRATAGLVEVTDYYLICVDAEETRTGVVTLACKNKDEKSCHTVGDLLDTGRSYVVRVWREPDVQELVSLTGTAGYAHVYDPLKSKATARVVDRSAQLWYFDSRQSGDMTLTVAIWKRNKPDDAAAIKVIEVPKTYRVRGNYKLVFRFGLGFSWAPGASKLGVETTADGQKYVAVTEGGKYGLFDNELVVGMTYFPWSVREGTLEPRLAFGLRLGLISLGTDGKWFRSLMVGPEFAIGPDVSIGVFGGIVPYDRPRDGYLPGALLAPSVSKVPTGSSVAPAVGLALNFTPGFLHVFGVDK